MSDSALKRLTVDLGSLVLDDELKDTCDPNFYITPGDEDLEVHLASGGLLFVVYAGVKPGIYSRPRRVKKYAKNSAIVETLDEAVRKWKEGCLDLHGSPCKFKNHLSESKNQTVHSSTCNIDPETEINCNDRPSPRMPDPVESLPPTRDDSLTSKKKSVYYALRTNEGLLSGRVFDDRSEAFEALDKALLGDAEPRMLVTEDRQEANQFIDSPRESSFSSPSSFHPGTETDCDTAAAACFIGNAHPSPRIPAPVESPPPIPHEPSTVRSPPESEIKFDTTADGCGIVSAAPVPHGSPRGKKKLYYALRMNDKLLRGQVFDGCSEAFEAFHKALLADVEPRMLVTDNHQEASQFTHASPQ